MTRSIKDILADEQALREVKHLQALDGNPLDAEQEAMFVDFLREGLSHEECRARITEYAMQRAGISAAE